MRSLIVSACKNGHHFINSEKCDMCGEPIINRLPFMEGDCISCGELCPGHAYACKDHLALTPEDFK